MFNFIAGTTPIEVFPTVSKPTEPQFIIDEVSELLDVLNHQEQSLSEVDNNPWQAAYSVADADLLIGFGEFVQYDSLLTSSYERRNILSLVSPESYSS
ncbi:MAG: hypothetical protein IJ050_11005 [Clostridia bacterium]|nr:hypothetical protein [Clostridia bacterium]